MGKLALAAIVSSWVVPITIMVNRIVTEPYMDEIFHIPQAQQYCKGNFGSWDPMITTPPGLYYLSLAHVASLFPGLYCVEAASSFLDVCSAFVLRSINGVLAITCSIILYDIIIHLRPTLGDRKAMLHAVVLSLYPLHWFFTFLYYTDVASITAVLAMYLASLKKNYWLSALVGAFAVVVRQTNIIWVLFVACIGIIDISLMRGKGSARMAKSDVSVEYDFTNATGTSSKSLNLKRRKAVKTVNTAEHYLPMISATSHFSSDLFDEIWAVILTIWHMKLELLISFSPYLMVLIAFLLFVYWNGSIVLGAKEAHAVSPHFAQILYFGLVSVLAQAPMHFTFTHAVNMFQSFWRSRPLSYIQMFLALIAGILSVHFFRLHLTHITNVVASRISIFMFQ